MLPKLRTCCIEYIIEALYLWSIFPHVPGTLGMLFLMLILGFKYFHLLVLTADLNGDFFGSKDHGFFHCNFGKPNETGG
jgi:hypothetical protein